MKYLKAIKLFESDNYMDEAPNGELYKKIYFPEYSKFIEIHTTLDTDRSDFNLIKKLMDPYVKFPIIEEGYWEQFGKKTWHIEFNNNITFNKHADEYWLIEITSDIYSPISFLVDGNDGLAEWIEMFFKITPSWRILQDRHTLYDDDMKELGCDN
jgi:hypothetical protein